MTIAATLLILAMSAESLYIASQGGRSLKRGRRMIDGIQQMAIDTADGLTAGWSGQTDAFRTLREPYLLYPS